MAGGGHALVSVREDGSHYVIGPHAPLPVSSGIEEKIEDGQVYIHDDLHLAVGAGASIYHLLKVGVKELHLIRWHIIASTAPGTAELTEAPVVSADGTAETVINKRRSSMNASLAAIFSAPTFSDPGSHLESTLLTGSRLEGGSQPGTQGEWVLAANTDYLFSYNNDSTGSADLEVHFSWYEEEVH